MEPHPPESFKVNNGSSHRLAAFANRARLSTIHLTRELNKLTGGFRTLDGGSSLPSGSVESDKAELLLKQEERIKSKSPRSLRSRRTLLTAES
jgi:hypothetical protein